jgi:CRP-like cAMP-binding protein
MPEYPPRIKCSNLILSRLSRADFSLLHHRLEPVELPLRTMLQRRSQRVKSVYFIESGFASVVDDAVDPGIEVGIIGNEGMTGLSVVLGIDDRVETETYMQAAGSGFVIRTADLRATLAASTTLHGVMLRYVHAFMMQVTRTAVANGRTKVEERLARWLLMASDRVDGEVQLTHEFLSLMLGVRRSGVTVALKALERERLISHRRGAIAILDGDRLRERSNGTYVAPDGQ